SYSAVYGGRSRTPGSPARPFFGSTVAVSNTVVPIICQAPLQSGSAKASAERCCACAAAATKRRTARNMLTDFMRSTFRLFFKHRLFQPRPYSCRLHPFSSPRGRVTLPLVRTGGELLSISHPDRRRLLLPCGDS